MPKIELNPRCKLDTKGRIVIPLWIRERINVKKGALVEMEVYGKDKILLTILDAGK